MSNSAFDPLVVDLAEMDLVIPSANAEGTRDWVREVQVEAIGRYNQAINDMRIASEDIIFTERALGRDPNNENDFPEVYTRLIANVGVPGPGDDHPESYVLNTKSIGLERIASVAGISTMDPDGTRARSEFISEGVVIRDNWDHFINLRTVALNEMNGLAARIEYRDANGVPNRTDQEISNAFNVIQDAVKRRKLTPVRVFEGVYRDNNSMHPNP